MSHLILIWNYLEWFHTLFAFINDNIQRTTQLDWGVIDFIEKHLRLKLKNIGNFPKEHCYKDLTSLALNHQTWKYHYFFVFLKHQALLNYILDQNDIKYIIYSLNLIKMTLMGKLYNILGKETIYLWDMEWFVPIIWDISVCVTWSQFVI